MAEELTAQTNTDDIITLKELLEAGVHFGHQTRRWNPKMKPYIFGVRNGIHIIDLEKTLPLFVDAYNFIVETVARGGKVLFVGTKKQAQDVIREEAERCGMFYVSHRWLGGTLTNFRTIRQSIDKMKTIQAMFETENGTAGLTKKEVLKLSRKLEKLDKNYGGIRDLDGTPDVVFIVDPNKEHIALHEANRLGIPVVAITDTNCDPDPIDYVIPGNDDALRSIKLFAEKIADAVLKGKKLAMERREGLDEEAEKKVVQPKAEAEEAQPKAEAEQGPAVEVVEAEPELPVRPEAAAKPENEK